MSFDIWPWQLACIVCLELSNVHTACGLAMGLVPWTSFARSKRLHAALSKHSNSTVSLNLVRLVASEITYHYYAISSRAVDRIPLTSTFIDKNPLKNPQRQIPLV
ncbi:hypothetical protein SISSUDRAFT_292674 [Sistotremastrum suecicum HHB10207 ss-3]|uniref:Uncharacterized protein n=1 Tax=Sistotremastrum suecicum HHB10207 ss-3 TaxID=1314776 RepID=A0A165ZIV7_9AGAM|nr:hypothetical protein SISSUDRAFT_292674 [Sistotremastrum suecicum HHB10207 ss-3]